MSGFHSFTRRYLVEFSSADPIATFRQLTKTNISLYRITQIDDFTYRFDLKRNSKEEVIRILDRYAETYRITSLTTIYTSFIKLHLRPVLLIGMLLIAFLTCFLPTRVLFVQVKGNETMPMNRIISVANTCGITFGASRREVRSEEVKNRMLAQLPQLEWVGVNTYGCVAEISVQEGMDSQKSESPPRVGSIVASRDGVVLSCTTLQGTQICRPGQAVSKGQLLVSGYTDCGIYIQGTMAKGEVLAATTRKLCIMSPNSLQKRYPPTETERRFYLIIGKNLIKFNKDSGIPAASCAKIKKEYHLVLPGGFTLPVCLIEEYIVHHEAELEEIDPSWAVEYGRKYLNSQMITGKIISEEIQQANLDGVTEFDGIFFCTEMIGQTKFEETM